MGTKHTKRHPLHYSFFLVGTYFVRYLDKFDAKRFERTAALYAAYVGST